MRKNNKINYEIMTWPQEKTKYKELAVRIFELKKKYTEHNKQLDKIIKILGKLVNYAK